MRRRSSTRWVLAAAVAAMVALVVSPGATTASFTIVPGGPPVTVTVSNEGGTSNATFTGTAGQRVSLNFTNVTITSSKVSFLTPDGTNLVTPFTVTRSGSWLDVKTLPATGTYKILVDPRLDYTGRMNLTLYDVPADPTAPVATNGTPVTATTTTPGQNALLTFSGTAGNRVSVELSDVSWSSARLRILKPDATALFPTAYVFGPAGGFLEPKTLPDTGTYTLVLDPRLLATGSATVKVYDVAPDMTGAITPGGSGVTVTTTSPGQNGTLTFAGTAGQRVSFLLSNSTYGLAKVNVRTPSGADLYPTSAQLAGLDAFLDRKTLPATGTYTVFVDPQSADTGQLDVTAYNVPADQTGALAANTPLNAATAVPGQNVAFVYSGTANQRVSLNLTNVTYDRAKVSILKPDGSALFSPALLVTSAGGFLEPKKLPTTGTYTVKVDPEGAYTGAMDVTLYSVPADATATIAANATPVTVSNTVPGQNASLTFANAASKRISLKLTGVTMADTAFSGLKVKILQPDGSTLASATLGTDGKFFDTQSATQTGTYKILLDPQGPVTGSATLTLYTVPADTTAPILANGTPTTIAVATPGQSATLTFSGAANQRVAFRVSKGAVSSLKVSLAKSGSTSYVFFPTSVSVDPQFFDTKSLGASGGTFKITLDPQGDYTGSMTVTLWTVPADATGTLTPGSNNVTLTTGQNARLTFTATAGQTATVTFSSGTIAQAWARILSPTGTQLESSFWDPTVTNSPVTETLTQTGTYTFLLDPVGDKTGSMTFSLSLS